MKKSQIFLVAWVVITTFDLFYFFPKSNELTVQIYSSLLFLLTFITQMVLFVVLINLISKNKHIGWWVR